MRFAASTPCVRLQRLAWAAAYQARALRITRNFTRHAEGLHGVHPCPEHHQPVQSKQARECMTRARSRTFLRPRNQPISLGMAFGLPKIIRRIPMAMETVAARQAPQDHPIRLFLTLPEAAQALAISLSMVRKLIRMKQLKAHKIGSRTVIHVAEMRRYVSSLEVL